MRTGKNARRRSDEEPDSFPSTESIELSLLDKANVDADACFFRTLFDLHYQIDSSIKRSQRHLPKFHTGPLARLSDETFKQSTSLFDSVPDFRIIRINVAASALPHTPITIPSGQRAVKASDGNANSSQDQRSLPSHAIQEDSTASARNEFDPTPKRPRLQTGDALKAWNVVRLCGEVFKRDGITPDHQKNFYDCLHSIKVFIGDAEYSEWSWSKRNPAENRDNFSSGGESILGFELKLPMVEQTSSVCFEIYFKPEFQNRFELSPVLKGYLGVDLATKEDIIDVIWNHIATNRLASVDNPSIVIVDPFLKDILSYRSQNTVATANHARVSLPKIYKALDTHLSPFEKLRISGDIGPEVSGLLCSYDYRYDFPRAEDTCAQQASDADLRRQITKMDTEYEKMLRSWQSARQRRDFFNVMALSPYDCMHAMLVHQGRELELLNPAACPSTQSKKTSFYSKRWVNEAVPIYFIRKALFPKAKN
uniref:DM2 domain-containing protein n=1 Tax=Timspurckia oligopyrenoides TaxID=708627 RepID=A0A7S0ZEY1_9RHOD|mmetsp:Transcript_2667/g.4706  ORF Transcript_2667/g.4706 Transcript_2667/m.4706 type:complete len:481 (+) Transcript_2667:104-1546(+)|eukprot:CAMPEP_0182443228 /NCGR_PEP_ID=MMETSP1172-20130603/2006_1 /TAXON_ID=708627 /ORGANISM="Timspurckia oligopyrenoides, Strain CCMP3278" /LENGTH=480 /DNA_ID=CAMNT_0024638421 /DNA_START=36 /DNA_END=1478 /DNA_ORIENTATION=+